MKEHHISDTILQQLLDGALSSAEVAMVTSHLQHCPDCRRLKQQYEEIYRELSDAQLPAVPEKWTQMVSQIPQIETRPHQAGRVFRVSDIVILLIFIVAGIGSWAALDPAVFLQVPQILKSSAGMFQRWKSLMGLERAFPLVFGGMGVVFFYMILDHFRQKLRLRRFLI